MFVNIAIQIVLQIIVVLELAQVIVHIVLPVHYF